MGIESLLRGDIYLLFILEISVMILVCISRTFLVFDEGNIGLVWWSTLDVFDDGILFIIVCIVIICIWDACMLDDCMSYLIRVGEEYIDGFSIVFCGVV